jgi:hypothetical protein
MLKDHEHWNAGRQGTIDPESAPAASYTADRQDRWFLCEDCGHDHPESTLCCGDYDADGSIIDGHCVTCCKPNHRGRISDGKSVAGGTFQRGE